METDTSRSPSGSDGAAAGESGTGTRRKLSDEQEREVTRLYAETETPVSEVSKRFGIGKSSVYRVAQRHGAALLGRASTTSGPNPRASAASSTPAAGGTGRGRGRRGRPASATSTTTGA